MDTQLVTPLSDPLEPQLAFQAWLGDVLEALATWLRREDDAAACFSRAVDHADLERRMRAYERGSPTQLFW